MNYKSNNIRCISIDLDGTLIAPGHRTHRYIHPDNIQAMKEFCKVEGNKIVIATGKTVQSTLEIFRYLQKQSFTSKEIPYLICLNGAEIVDTTQLDQPVLQTYFEKDVCERIFQYLSKHRFKYLAFTPTNSIRSLHFLSWLVYKSLFRQKNKLIVSERASLNNLQKVLILLLWPLSKKKIQEMMNQFNDDCYVSKCCKFCWEITDKNIDKFFGLQFVAKRLGLDMRDFAAMGNEQNDVMSLENVGFGVGINLPKRLQCDQSKIELLIQNWEGTAVCQAIREMKNRNLW